VAIAVQWQTNNMKIKAFLAAIVFFSVVACDIQGAPGDVDRSFDAGSSLNSPAYAIAVQADGKILIGGDFTTVAGGVRRRIARLNPDGTMDASFDPGAGANGYVRCIVVQPDGKVLIGGWFTAVNGVTRNRIARLNANGSVDASFNPGGSSGADDMIFSIAVQPDGKILVGGYFTCVGGLSRPYLARLNPDGSVDSSFNPGANNYVYSIVLQPDGKILVGGAFSTLGSGNLSRIGRLTPDGSVDPSFNPGSGVGYFSVYAMALQPDGRVVIGGGFSTVNGATHQNIARLNPNGSVDPSFNASANASDVDSMALQADGKIVMAGQFFAVNGSNRTGLARLNIDGTLDTAFVTQLGDAGAFASTVAIDSAGKIFISGQFASVNHVSRNGFAKLNADGTVDPSLNPSTGINGSVYSIGLQPDGRMIVGGYFGGVKDSRHDGIARLQKDGSLDPGFNAGPMFNTAYYGISNSVVYSVVLQPDGKVIVGGGFTNINGIARNNIARLNADGSMDMTFNPGAGADYSVYRVILQPDGKVLIVGAFTTVNRVPRRLFARLNANGSLDGSFNPDIGDGLPCVGLQPDGRMVVAGYRYFNPSYQHFITRLNPDGTTDPSFNSVPVTNFVTSLSVLANGKILLGGYFTNLGGVPRNRIARLNSDGILDLSFNPAGPDGNVAWNVFDTTAIEQPDGKLLVWGDFTSFNGVARPGLVRLHPNGSVDTRFNAGTGINWMAGPGMIATLVMQPDSRILIGGGFSSINGVARMAITRLKGEGLVILTQPSSGTAAVGTPATFSVNATGPGPLRYQWYRNGGAVASSDRISGATTATLAIHHVQFHDAGTYTVVVSNDEESISSNPAVLNVTSHKP
jgi:uncharacterized delta-60 repeat protein